MAKMIGMGRLGKDAELRHTPSGDAVANLAIAFNYGKKDAQTGNRPTQWVDASLWGKQAEAITQFLSKGSVHCFTLDDLHIESYKKNDGSEGFKLVARCVDVELGPRGDAGSTQSAPRQAAPAPRQAPAPAPRPAPSDFNDDIPFAYSNIGISMHDISSQFKRSKIGRGAELGSEF